MDAIIHKQSENRFEMTVDGTMAYVEYEIQDGSIDILHTVVPKEIGGRGIAAALVEATYRYGRSRNLLPEATCSYAATWLKRHPEQ